jgi:hypothetical protein
MPLNRWSAFASKADIPAAERGVSFEPEAVFQADLVSVARLCQAIKSCGYYGPQADIGRGRGSSSQGQVGPLKEALVVATPDGFIKERATSDRTALQTPTFAAIRAPRFNLGYRSRVSIAGSGGSRARGVPNRIASSIRLARATTPAFQRQTNANTQAASQSKTAVQGAWTRQQASTVQKHATCKIMPRPNRLTDTGRKNIAITPKTRTAATSNLPSFFADGLIAAYQRGTSSHQTSRDENNPHMFRLS